MWITLSEADILTGLSGPETTAYRSAAKAPGQADPLPLVLNDTIEEARGRVRANTINVMGPDGTIPTEIKQHIINLARYQLITRLPNILIDPNRQKQFDVAVEALKDVARGLISIVPPVEPSTEPEAFQRPSICAGKKRFGRRDQEGI